MLEIGRSINYEIHISPSHNRGFIVKVGCGTFVAKDRQELLCHLTESLENPKRAEDAYSKLGPQAEIAVDEAAPTEDARPVREEVGPLRNA